MRLNGKLIEIHPYRSVKDGKWYLELIYEFIDEKGKHREIYPKVSIPFSQDGCPSVHSGDDRHFYIECDSQMRLFEGTNSLAVSKGGGLVACIYDVLIEPAEPKEMTLEEIEKKLGYRVKVVSKEDE